MAQSVTVCITEPHLQDAIQKVRVSRYISVMDAKSEHWQIGVREQDRWLTAFVYDGSLYEWCRIPFGLKTAGSTFCRCIKRILRPIHKFSFSFVDDKSIGSVTWDQHLSHLRSFLTEISKSGLTLSFKKC